MLSDYSIVLSCEVFRYLHRVRELNVVSLITQLNTCFQQVSSRC